MSTIFAPLEKFLGAGVWTLTCNNW